MALFSTKPLLLATCLAFASSHSALAADDTLAIPFSNSLARTIEQLVAARDPTDLLVTAGTLTTVGEAARVDSPMDAYYRFIYWLSVGRPDRALEQFDDRATVVGGPDCPVAAPCTGKPAIASRYLAWQQRASLSLLLADQRFDGEMLTTHGDVPVDLAPGESPGGLKGGYDIEFQDGRISSLRFGWDLDDVATAKYLRGSTVTNLGLLHRVMVHEVR